jgi:hypothetical protein
VSVLLDFVASTPKVARDAIAQLRTLVGLTDEQRALLDRLASDPVMAEVWSKLPDRESMSGDVIVHAFDAARAVLAQRPPYPKRGKIAQQKYALEMAKRGPTYTLESVATCALWLREDMIATRQLMQSIHPELKLDELLTVVDYIERNYREADEKQTQYWRQFHCPIRGASAKNVKEIRFSKLMSRYLKEKFGQPWDGVVVALTQAIFGKVTTEETVRKRRKSP